LSRGRGRVASLAVLLATAIGFAVAAPHFKFSTKITAFLPDSADRGAQIAALLAQSELARVMVIDLSLAQPDADPDRLGALTGSLLDALHARPDVATARSGFTEADVTAMVEFLAAWPATTFLPRTAYADAAVRTRLEELREQLGSELGLVVRTIAPRDPLGGMWEPLDALRLAQGTALADTGGILFTADHTHAFVFVETRASPFDSEAQRAFRAGLDAWIASQPANTLRMQTAGTAQYAIASEAQIKGDVNRIGIISTVGILAIFLVLFGSLRLTLVGFVPMIFGSVVAVLGCQALFGEIHGITIAFGTSLLGVGLDYVEHYYAHFALSPTVPAETTMRRVAPSLVLGALTTIIGFIGLGASGLMGLRQMAVFSVIAIIAAMAATYWIVPPWMPATYRPPRTLAIAHRAVQAMLIRVTSRTWGRGLRVVVIVVVAVAAVAVIRAARFSDNVNMLVSEGGPHVLDDRAVRSRLGPESSTFAVVTAANDDALLAAVGAAAAELERARADGSVTSFVPLGRILPSRDEQAARFAAAQAAAPAVRRIMEELEFVPGQFHAVWDALAAPPPAPLTLADLRGSPLGPLVATWVPAQASPPVALIPLVGVTDLASLRAKVPSATIIAPTETVVELFRGVRIRTAISSAVGLAAILLVLLVRYRGLRKAVIALTPAVLACVAAVGTLVIAGVALTILHVMSLLLVISLGVDFGIFFVDTTTTAEEAARTMVSILTASLTTILSFGLLGLSESPGLAAIGVTVTLGVTFSLVACLFMASLSRYQVVTGDRSP
jgi:predicted exporter